ncbi:4-(cytidine 5'-diphospho)-2-C-methyl-D-erythritol kinase [Ruminococcaceae bacterium OttesenSCG-928-A11]|nr:4-(cytidine 5'-diphospho)-2-C-methyl-D-erythritol kinase [Ruminococcaceae bacterium OttesenSCG-928-A11]
MRKVVVEAPAKLNLSLAVTGLAANGYHTVDMVMQAVGLWERIEVVRSMGYSLRLPKSPVAAGEKNTATKAAKAFFHETGLLAGADITVHKKIPTRAGMAGGSADAAGVLVGLNALYGARLSLEKLCEIGATIGADVPFSLLGGTARATGTGETLHPLRPLENCWFAIAMPHGGGVSTPEAYQRFDTQGSPLCPDVAAACAAIEGGNLAGLLPQMQNMLEHANSDGKTRALRALFDRHGALASMMTGSGAAVFGLFSTRAEAEKAARAAKPLATGAWAAPPVASGPRITVQE